MKPKISIKTIIAILAVFIIVIVGISTFFIIEEASKTASITFMIAPGSANITLNNQSYSNSHTHRIKPGTYNLSITKEGYFEPFQESFSIESGETKEYYMELKQLEGAEDYYSLFPEDAKIFDPIIAREIDDANDYIKANFPLLGVLPITVEYYLPNGADYVHYIISYSWDMSSDPTVIIKDYTGGNQSLALERIRSEGYNPDDYTIEYRDLSSSNVFYQAESDE